MEFASSQTQNFKWFTCPVCLLPYSNPKVLPCLHSFCDACLRKELPSQSFTLVCPVCRNQFILSPQGISSLQTNVFLLELEKFLAEDKSDCATLSSQEDNLLCSSHAGQTLRFYCNDCESAVCSSCTDIAHGNHVKVRLEQAALEQAKALQSIMDISKSQVLSIEQAASDLAAHQEALEAKYRETEMEMEQNFEKLFDALTLRKETLHQELNLMHKAHTQALTQARQQYQSDNERLADVVHLIERIVQHNNPLYLLILRKQLDSDRSLLFNTEQFAQLRASALPKFDSSAVGIAENMLCSIGAVYNLSDADAVHTQIRGNIVESKTAVPNKPYTIYIEVHSKVSKSTLPGDVIPPPKVHIRGPLQEDSSLAEDSLSAPGKLGSVSMNSLSNVSDQSGFRNSPSPVRRLPCPIHSAQTTPGGSTRASSPSISSKQRKPSFLLSLKVRDHGNSTYETVLVFPDRGQYEVNVTLADKHITGSPFKIVAEYSGPEKSTLSMSGRQSSASGNFQRANSGRRSSSRLSTASRPPPIEDDLICRIGMRGRGKGEFTNPQDICCTTNGRILATDSNNQCVQIFSSSGEFRSRFGTRGRSVGQLQRPTGIALLPSTGQYLLADYENRWVSLYEPNGKYASRFGMGKLLGPKGLAVDRTGQIFVVDNKASTICVFQSNGRFVGRFGSRGCSQDHLAGPHFIAINSYGQAVVSDFHNHAVKVFDTTGQFLFSFGSSGEDSGQFNAPTGIAIDSMDNILVADWGNSRIQVFDRYGTFMRTVDSRADPLYGPQGVAITADGNVVVADSGNHCLKLYKYNSQSDDCIQSD